MTARCSVGHTDLREPLVAWRANKETREQAVAKIARRCRRLVDIFETVESDKIAHSNITRLAD